NKSKVFDTFPFPDASSEQRAQIAHIAEDLDSTRRAALAENDRLTMTGLYNLVEQVRAGTLPPGQEAHAVRARARIVAKLHDDLDAAVAAAYGWAWPLPPSDIISRLVALNTERAAEEQTGKVRWLRPKYQEPRFVKK
ncbi:MAG: class I SAM-dependent DNA methyltransferase, partial [Sphingomicrobium sp.]